MASNWVMLFMKRVLFSPYKRKQENDINHRVQRNHKLVEKQMQHAHIQGFKVCYGMRLGERWNVAVKVPAHAANEETQVNI
jgi:hypothetical protein